MAVALIVRGGARPGPKNIRQPDEPSPAVTVPE
jgi:hypothetical protein